MTERMIFGAALERDDPAERAAYLEQVCAGDAGLRRRIDELLEAHFAPGAFLEAPAGISNEPPRAGGQGQSATDQLDSVPIVEVEGSKIGPYKLLQKIGEGGMGVVYMAEQEKPVRRRVAVKIIKPGMDSRQVVARFEAERQALALMDHPNIAKVLDAGTTDTGRPYFVMDLVKGIPITQYCDEARLSPRERLELFLPLCQAIQHAHQKGIIHRDVKPSNVLVTLIDGKPVPKVIDFGVAKAIDHRLTERTLFTQFGAIIGTPEYMSPEQADLSGLDVDTRSDIYSLGVLLYELLTGSTPLERQRLREAGYAEILRRIKEEEPRKPSTRLSHSGDQLASIAATRSTEPARLTRLVRGELDWIVMKSLEKERTRRYDTASGLARDIQRYLDGDAVEAGPPSAAYRLLSFARKHRAAFVTVSAFAVLLVVATAVSAYLAVRAHRAERVATDERDRAIVAEATAVAAERAAKAEAKRATTEAAISRAVNEFLQRDLLGQADLDNQEDPGTKPDADIRVRTLLDRAAAKIGGKFVDKPEVEVAVRQTIGHAYLAMGLFDVAESQLEPALALARCRLGNDHIATLESMVNMAGVQYFRGRYLESRSLLSAALDGLRRVHGEEHPVTILAMRYLGCQLIENLELSQAEPLLLRSVTLSRKVLGEDHWATLATIRDLAGVHLYAGNFREGEERTKNVLHVARRILGGDNTTTLLAVQQLAYACRLQGMYGRADELVTEATEGFTKLRGAETTWVATVNFERAWMFTDVGRIAEADALLTKTEGELRRNFGEDSDYMCWAKVMRAETRQAHGKLSEAETFFAQSIAAWGRTRGTQHPIKVAAIVPLAELYLEEGLLGKAETLLVEAQGAAAILGGEGMYLAECPTTTLSRLRLRQRRFAEAEATARRALAVRLERHPDHWTRFDGMSLLGGALAGQKKFAEAEPLLTEGYEGLKERQERIPFLWRAKRPAQAGTRIVELYEAWGKTEKAAEWRSRLKEAAPDSRRTTGARP